jgi:hypothetical protein
MMEHCLDISHLSHLKSLSYPGELPDSSEIGPFSRDWCPSDHYKEPIPGPQARSTATPTRFRAALTLPPLESPYVSLTHEPYPRYTNGGGIEIADATGIIFSMPIATAGPKRFPFPGGFYKTRGKPLAVILKAGGAGVTGTLNMRSR